MNPLPISESHSGNRIDGSTYPISLDGDFPQRTDDLPSGRSECG